MKNDLKAVCLAFPVGLIGAIALNLFMVEKLPTWQLIVVFVPIFGAGMLCQHISSKGKIKSRNQTKEV